MGAIGHRRLISMIALLLFVLKMRKIVPYWHCSSVNNANYKW